MAHATCPSCSAPMTQAEAAGGVCPLCGASLAVVDVAAAPPMPSPAAVKLAQALAGPKPPRVPAWAMVALLLLINVIIWLVFVMSKPAQVPTPTAPLAMGSDAGNAASDASNSTARTDAAPATTAAPATPIAGEKTSDTEASPDSGKQPSAASDVALHGAANGAPILPDLPPPQPAVPEVKGEEIEGEDVVLFRPNESFTIRRVDGGRKMKLRGKIETLVIYSVNGKSEIDASQLEAKRIIVAGGINGGSTVKLNAPGGSIEFRRCLINGNSTVVAHAPGGSVSFVDSKRNPTEDCIIDGESSLTITAKEAVLSGSMEGTKTRVQVTLTNGGSLRYGEVNGQVRLHYRKADAKDPEPVIIAGAVKSGAEVRRLE